MPKVYEAGWMIQRGLIWSLPSQEGNSYWAYKNMYKQERETRWEKGKCNIPLSSEEEENSFSWKITKTFTEEGTYIFNNREKSVHFAMILKFDLSISWLHEKLNLLKLWTSGLSARSTREFWGGQQHLSSASTSDPTKQTTVKYSWAPTKDY